MRPLRDAQSFDPRLLAWACGAGFGTHYFFACTIHAEITQPSLHCRDVNARESSTSRRQAVVASRLLSRLHGEEKAEETITWPQSARESPFLERFQHRSKTIGHGVCGRLLKQYAQALKDNKSNAPALLSDE